MDFMQKIKLVDKYSLTQERPDGSILFTKYNQHQITLVKRPSCQKAIRVTLRLFEGIFSKLKNRGLNPDEFLTSFYDDKNKLYMVDVQIPQSIYYFETSLEKSYYLGAIWHCNDGPFEKIQLEHPAVGNLYHSEKICFGSVPPNLIHDGCDTSLRNRKLVDQLINLYWEKTFNTDLEDVLYYNLTQSSSTSVFIYHSGMRKGKNLGLQVANSNPSDSLRIKLKDIPCLFFNIKNWGAHTTISGLHYYLPVNDNPTSEYVNYADYTVFLQSVYVRNKVTNSIFKLVCDFENSFEPPSMDYKLPFSVIRENLDGSYSVLPEETYSIILNDSDTYETHLWNSQLWANGAYTHDSGEIIVIGETIVDLLGTKYIVSFIDDKYLYLVNMFNTTPELVNLEYHKTKTEDGVEVIAFETIDCQILNKFQILSLFYSDLEDMPQSKKYWAKIPSLNGDYILSDINDLSIMLHRKMKLNYKVFYNNLCVERVFPESIVKVLEPDNNNPFGLNEFIVKGRHDTWPKKWNRLLYVMENQLSSVPMTYLQLDLTPTEDFENEVFDRQELNLTKIFLPTPKVFPYGNMWNINIKLGDIVSFKTIDPNLDNDVWRNHLYEVKRFEIESTTNGNFHLSMVGEVLGSGEEKLIPLTLNGKWVEKSCIIKFLPNHELDGAMCKLKDPDEHYDFYSPLGFYKNQTFQVIGVTRFYEFGNVGVSDWVVLENGVVISIDCFGEYFKLTGRVKKTRNFNLKKLKSRVQKLNVIIGNYGREVYGRVDNYYDYQSLFFYNGKR